MNEERIALTEEISSILTSGVELIISDEAKELISLYPTQSFLLINSNFSDKYKLEVTFTAIPILQEAPDENK